MNVGNLMFCVAFGFAAAGPVLAAEDGLFAGDATLEVGPLVAAVLERNPGLAEMRASTDAAESRIEPAGALGDPMLTLSAAPNTFGSGLGSRGQLQVSQELPWWGTLDARETAARANTDAAGQDVEAMRRRLRAAAVTAFAEWRFVHTALAVNARHQELLTEIREIARGRYAAGRAPQHDVLQAELERASLRQRALELEGRVATIRARINTLLDRPAGSHLPPPGEPSIPATLPPLERLEPLVVDRHPAVRGLQHRQRAARAAVELAEKARFPEFRVMAGYNGVMDPVEKRLSVGVSVSLPLDQGKRRANIDGARAHERSTSYAVQDRRAQLVGELSSVYAAAEQAQRSLTLYRDELIPLTEHTLAVSTAEYSAGTGDFLKVIASERHRLEITLGAARTEAALLQHIAELDRLTGAELPHEVTSNDQ